MPENLIKILRQRHNRRDISIKWVFWHQYHSRKQGKIVKGPYNNRSKFMKSLCEKAGVKYFRFHPLRHAGASIMESIGIPISHIQELLGHENRKTTEGYIHLCSDSKIKAIKQLEAKRGLS